MSLMTIREIPVLDALLPPETPVFHCGCCHGFARRFERLLALVDEAPPAVRLPLVAGLAVAVAGAWSIDGELAAEDLWPLLCGGASGRQLREVQQAIAALRAFERADDAPLLFEEHPPPASPPAAPVGA